LQSQDDWARQKRPGQPAKLATTSVMLADAASRYVSGATIAVTGGKSIL
jgi:NAD(P)-dependent dehydrogenase (short-subunit alcohol dehydrogenase family)